MEDRSPQVLAVAVFFGIISWLTVSLRVYVRAGMIKSFGLDDWTMVLTLLLFTAYLVCQLGGYMHGTGKHIQDIKPADAQIALRFWFFCELFYILCSCMLKISLGIFLLRVAVRKMHVWIIQALMIGTAVFGTTYFFVVLFQCSPISTFWTVHPNYAPRCIQTDAIIGLTYCAGALTAIVDWTFGILPMFIVWDLNMNPKTKAVVAAILAFAAIGSTATIVRIPYVNGLKNGEDFLWATTDIAIWSTVEPGIGITAGCMATLRPLFQTFLFRLGLISTAPASAPMGNSKGPHRSSRFGYLRSHPMDDLRPDHVGTVTSVSGPGRTTRSERSWHDRSSSEERMVHKGISKQVVVEYSSEGV